MDMDMDMDNHIESWRGRVYKKSTSMKGFGKMKWDVIREKVLQRDGFCCYSCRKNFKMTELTAHHIISRDRGGKDMLSNLITLCVKCHNIIEPLNLSKKQIKGYCKDFVKVNFTKKEIAPDKDWRKWVYGGQRNPSE